MSIIPRKKNLLARLAGMTVVPLILGFMLCTPYLDRGEIVAYGWIVGYPALLVAFSLMLVATALCAYLWEPILSRLGTPLSYRKSYRIFFLSQLGRYIPGKVWSILGLVYLSQKEGMSKVISGASVALQLMLQLLSCVMVFAVTLPF